MKLIRTKSGVYETIGKEQPCRDGEIEVFCTKHNSVAKSWIIKQADTIEELVDRYVLNGIDIIFLNKDKTQYRFECEDVWYDITDCELRTGIYGAIWTEKGLIYVTKPMNDKGEFELL